MQISSEFTTLQIASFLHAEISCPCLLTFLVPRDLILTCAWHSQINSSVQYCFPSSVSTSVVQSTGWCYLLHIDLYLWKYRFAGRHHFFYKQMTYSATCAFLRSLLLTQTGMLLSSTHIQQIMWRTLIFPSILFLFKFSFLSLFSTSSILTTWFWKQTKAQHQQCANLICTKGSELHNFPRLYVTQLKVIGYWCLQP